MNDKIQRTLGQLVQREIICCVSSLVSHFAQNPEACCDDVSYDDDILPLLSQTIDNSERIEEIDDEIQSLEADAEREQEIRDELDEIESDPDNDTDPEPLRAELAELVDDDRSDTLDELREERDELEEPTDCEALEHWAVSKWFGNRLKEQGEIVGELFDMTIWGRCTSGQAIYLDSVVQDIANKMEILPGQKNDWNRE